MSKLNRRALFGTAGLLATMPLLPKDVGAVEQPAALILYDPDADIRAMEIARALCIPPVDVPEISSHWWEAAQQLVPSAPEQYPPEGYTFCDGSEGEDWDKRFGADILRRRTSSGPLFNVFLDGTQTIDAIAVRTGVDGWVAEGVRVESYDEDGAYSHYKLCDCRSSHGTGPHLQLRITYGIVHAVPVPGS